VRKAGVILTTIQILAARWRIWLISYSSTNLTPATFIYLLSKRNNFLRPDYRRLLSQVVQNNFFWEHYG